MNNMTDAPDLSIETERKIARQFMGRIQWQVILIGIGQSLLWLSNWYFVFTETYSLFLGFIVATLCACVAYLPSHEGQHGNISGRNKRWQWLDAWVGHITLIPLGMSYEVLRVTHMKHHAYTNDPDRDVDVNSGGDHWWQAAIGVHRGIPKKILALHAREDPAFAEAMIKGVPIIKAFSFLQLILVIFFPIEKLLLWWIPKKIAFSYIAVYFSWYPHYPLVDRGRYKNTRFWQISIPRYFCQSMQTHIIHHMYPGIPHWDEPKAMEALRPFMIARGIPGAEDIPEKITFNPLIAK